MVHPASSCACGVRDTKMTKTASFACAAGGHWACSRCAPRKKCVRHNTFCSNTGKLWYELNRHALPTERVLCQFGCTTFSDIKKKHTIWDCPQKNILTFSHAGGHIRGWHNARLYARKHGGTTLSSGALLYPRSKAWCASVMCTPAGGGTILFMLESTLFPSRQILGRIEDSTTGFIKVCPTTSPLLRDLFFRVWSSITFVEIGQSR